MKFILKIFFIFLSCSAFAQIPVAPELCFVTVQEQDSLVRLQWQHSDSSKITGFIIKRKIWGGNGVVEGSLNNIEFLPNTATSYVDTSFDYSTFSQPYTRAEAYSVNAYVIRNDSIIFSNLAPIQNTILLNSNWEICSRKASFSWNKYQNRQVLNYILLYSKNNIDYDTLTKLTPEQTEFSTNNLDSNCFYYFKIQATLEPINNCISDTSTSNITNLYSYIPNFSNDILINNVSVFENSYIRVNFSKNNLSGIKNYALFRDNLEIASFNKDNFPDFFDDYCDVTALHKYYFTAVDSCENKEISSDTVQNIVLRATLNDKEFQLSWNSTTIYKNNVDYYEIYAEYNNTRKLLKTINNSTFKTNISLSDVFGTNLNDETNEIKFQIVAQGQNALKSLSNTEIIQLTGILSVPNAFNPNSQNTENQFFTIKTAFITDFKIVISTQNGTIIYESNDINKPWDGRHKNGKLMPQNAYIYNITYKSTSGITGSKNGIVNLIY